MKAQKKIIQHFLWLLYLCSIIRNVVISVAGAKPLITLIILWIVFMSFRMQFPSCSLSYLSSVLLCLFEVRTPPPPTHTHWYFLFSGPTYFSRMHACVRGPTKQPGHSEWNAVYVIDRNGATARNKLESKRLRKDWEHREVSCQPSRGIGASGQAIACKGMPGVRPGTSNRRCMSGRPGVRPAEAWAWGSVGGHCRSARAEGPKE